MSCAGERGRFVDFEWEGLNGGASPGKRFARAGEVGS